MITTKCLVCGSTRLRADRALSGRLVCNSCGAPFGVKGLGKNKINISRNFSLNNKFFLFLVIFLLAFILVII